MPKIKYGQIGVGHAHASKIGVYRNSDDFEVIGVAEPDDRLRKRAEQSPVYKDLKWMTPEQLLNTPGLQMVGVETEVGDLLPTAETCLEAGMHIHLDKPAGESLPRFKKVLDSAAGKHRIVQMGYMYRYNPGFVLLKDMLKQGWLGEPFEVHAVMSKTIGPASRKHLEKYPGGTMFELGCHLIDLVHGVLGKPLEVHSYRQHVSPVKDDLLDNMLAVMVYDKSIATVKSSLVEVDGFARRHFVVCGTEGTFHFQPLDNPSARLALSKPHGPYRKGYQEIKLPKYSRYVGDAAELAKAIRQEKEITYTYEHDLAVQESLLKASGLPIDK